MKAPECLDGTQPFKVRSFIQSFQLIVHNDREKFSQDRKKVLYATSFLIGRAAKWIEPYLSNLTNQDPDYLLNSWSFFESQLFTLFGDPNKSRISEAELDSLRMKEGGNVSLYIADFRSLVSIIGDWGERVLIHHFRKGLPSRILDQLASHPSRIDSLQDFMDVTLELDTRYHERKKQKSHYQEKKPEASKLISSSSSQKKKKNFQKRYKPHSSFLNKDFKLMNYQRERRIKEGLCTYGVIDTSKGEDLILGFDFLDHFNPSIDWKRGLITFHADQKDYYDPSNTFSKDFSSAKLFAALVGDSRTPSIPSSVHIPSLNSHQSLPSSRDEVFKEIQYVGEDDSVSSLHLFFGNMDLPPSSYHDCLEELWDEEEEPEEIETMMKVVPAVYHQYLEVFSKVKAEKLPPHCACDHHIDLEGSLPPEALSQFHQLKEAFTTAPILSHFNPSLPNIVETDASDYALGAVLSHVSDSGKHPISFDRCMLISAELNYEIHDKEFLGIVWDLKCWRAFLLSLSLSFAVLTDHSSLQYFMSSKVLTCCQAFWDEFLSEFHFSITYRPGCLATLPDTLSRQKNIYPEGGGFHHQESNELSTAHQAG
ncbi:hypothetical protein O181_042510 [Austropuccinia psidii MF-1]|uniref:Retrotransposon gag domain-containing protein n=1 Tax=Austropuccinia psidii MF-1 TaxID=1389203 RepID=A0A9Q3HI94_9BASI|nr:hypothetical protein [Austropuccinia psidii MF-1]